jgi:hypothetical protein
MTLVLKSITKTRKSSQVPSQSIFKTYIIKENNTLCMSFSHMTCSGIGAVPSPSVSLSFVTDVLWTLHCLEWVRGMLYLLIFSRGGVEDIFAKQ